MLVPTRELAAQVGEVLEPLAAARGLRVATAYGGVGLHDQAKKADRSHLLVGDSRVASRTSPTARCSR